jgi:hypothetical protein
LGNRPVGGGASPWWTSASFRSVPFSGAIAIAAVASMALGGFLFLNTLYLQDVRGYSAPKAGFSDHSDGGGARGLLDPLGTERR